METGNKNSPNLDALAEIAAGIEKDCVAVGLLGGDILQDFNEGLARFYAIANRLEGTQAAKEFDEALEKYRAKQEQERWRTDPLGLMWVFRFPELVMLSISGWSADALEAIANHLLTISSTIRRRL